MILLLALMAQPIPCETGERVLETPVPITFQNGRFGAPRSACPETALMIAGGTNLTADFADFYGNVRAFGLLDGSLRLGRYTAVFVELEVVRYQTVISSLSADSLGFGQTSVGTTYVLYPGELTVSGRARLSLPTASDYYQGARPLALDAALSLTGWVRSWLELHGEVGMLGSLGTGDGPLDPRGGLSLIGGATWRPTSWFALIADLNAQLFYDDPLDHLSIGGGARLMFGGLGIDLFAASPLLGRDRTTVAALLCVRYAFR